MKRFVVAVLAGLLFASPALAQMGGGPGGAGGGHGGGDEGAPPEPAPDDSDKAAAIGSSDRPHEMKPIPREAFAKAVTAMFLTADLNRDGMVTPAELQSIIASRREAIIRARFAEIDANHNGMIDMDEFVAWQQRLGSAAASSCSVYAGHVELVPETLAPNLGYGERNEALAAVIEPLSATLLIKANLHYRPGATLDDVLAYENARFDAADLNHDGYLDQHELNDWRRAHRQSPSMPGARGRPEARLDN